MVTRTIETYDNDGNLIETRVVEVPPEVANRETLESRARQALAVNQTYLNRTSPSPAQTTDQVKALTRQCSALIRLLVDELDDIAGT